MFKQLEFKKLCAIIMFVFVVCHAEAFAEKKDSDVTIENVYRRAEYATQLLNKLEYELGISRKQYIHLAVKDVSLREVYSQARVFLYKSVDFYDQVVRLNKTLSLSDVGIQKISSADVKMLVDLSIERLLKCYDYLNISLPSIQIINSDGKTVLDVFRKINLANQKLAFLNPRNIQPNQVYMEVMDAIGYVTQLNSTFPNQMDLDDAPLEKGKTPRDVYNNLLDCYNQIEDIAKASKLQVMKIDGVDFSESQVFPSDVIDLIAIIKTEVSYMHSLHPETNKPFPAYLPGFKTPSHVYQKTELLKRQLKLLKQNTTQYPKWIIQRD